MIRLRSLEVAGLYDFFAIAFTSLASTDVIADEFEGSVADPAREPPHPVGINQVAKARYFHRRTCRHQSIHSREADVVSALITRARAGWSMADIALIVCSIARFQIMPTHRTGRSRPRSPPRGPSDARILRVGSQATRLAGRGRLHTVAGTSRDEHEVRRRPLRTRDTLLASKT